MQIEVTEKEAREIYEQRYYDNRGKVKYLPLLILAVAIIAGVFVMSLINDWLGIATLVIITSPAIYMTLKSARASGKYARSQIAEQK